MNMRQIHIFYNQAIICYRIVSGFMKICTDLHRYDRKIVFVIVSEQFEARNNNKNNFVNISVQIFINPGTIHVK